MRSGCRHSGPRFARIVRRVTEGGPGAAKRCTAVVTAACIPVPAPVLAYRRPDTDIRRDHGKNG
ncbi:protein of unknown function [Streptomyces murinus]